MITTICLGYSDIYREDSDQVRLEVMLARQGSTTPDNFNLSMRFIDLKSGKELDCLVLKLNKNTVSSIGDWLINTVVDAETAQRKRDISTAIEAGKLEDYVKTHFLT